MTTFVRALAIAAVIAVATWGEGGAAAPSLLVAHLLLAVSVAAFTFAPASTTCAPSCVPTLAWLVFVVLAALSALAAPYAYAAWLVIVEVVAFTSLAWLASGEPVAVSRVLGPALALLASAHGIIAVVQKVAGSPRPASTFLNPNHLAAWLAAVSLFLVGRMFGGEGSFASRRAEGLAVLPALAGIFVTGSRGAVVGLAVGATALLALRPGRLTARARNRLQAAVAVLVLTAVLGVTVRLRGEDDPYRFHRTRIWAASLQAAAGSPWLGVGPGQFAAAAPNMNFPLPDAPLNYGRAFGSPHSDLLRAVCEFGFPAGLAAITAFAVAAWAILRRRAELSGGERGAMAALCALAAQGCVDDLTSRPALTMVGAAFAGLIVATRRDRPIVPAARATAAAAAFLVVSALIPGEIAGFAAWSRTQGLPQGRLDAAQLEKLRGALSWNPMHPGGWHRLAEHFVGDGRSWDVADYAAAREAAEHARRLQPADAFYARAVARVEATACLTIFPFTATRERAARLYDEALLLARTDATIPLEASKFLIQAGDADGARRAALRALAIEPRAAAPRVWLARAVLHEDGARGVAQAGRLLDEALTLAPRAGESAASSYDAALRALDANDVLALRRDLARAASPRGRDER